jgi:hypothetical protein
MVSRYPYITYLLRIYIFCLCFYLWNILNSHADTRVIIPSFYSVFVACPRTSEMIYLFFPDSMYLCYSTLLSRARAFDVSVRLHYAGKAWQREMFDILGRYVRSTTFMGVPSKLRAAKRKIMPVIWSRKYVWPRALWQDRVDAEIHR